jgi:hypothetical protein
LKKKEFIRPGHFIRYFPKLEGDIDNRYNYEATQNDLQFIAEFKGSPFNIPTFEKLIDFFEKENGDDSLVKPFQFFVKGLENLLFNRQIEEYERTYEVSPEKNL